MLWLKHIIWHELTVITPILAIIQQIKNTIGEKILEELLSLQTGFPVHNDLLAGQYSLGECLDLCARSTKNRTDWKLYCKVHWALFVICPGFRF